VAEKTQFDARFKSFDTVLKNINCDSPAQLDSRVIEQIGYFLSPVLVRLERFPLVQIKFKEENDQGFQFLNQYFGTPLEYGQSFQVYCLSMVECLTQIYNNYSRSIIFPEAAHSLLDIVIEKSKQKFIQLSTFNLLLNFQYFQKFPDKKQLLLSSFHDFIAIDIEDFNVDSKAIHDRFPWVKNIPGIACNQQKCFSIMKQLEKEYNACAEQLNHFKSSQDALFGEYKQLLGNNENLNKEKAELKNQFNECTQSFERKEAECIKELHKIKSNLRSTIAGIAIFCACWHLSNLHLSNNFRYLRMIPFGLLLYRRWK
jgi:hypothetical protein